MSASSRASIPSPPPIKNPRKRASTKDSKGDKSPPLAAAASTSVVPDMKPPKPCSNAEEYTPDRLQQSLAYANIILDDRRVLSPLGERAHVAYRESILEALKLEEEASALKEDEEKKATIESVKMDCIALIREHETNMQWKICGITQFPDVQKLMEEVLKLQKMALLARYGDYFAEICKRVRVAANAKQTAGWDALSGELWTKINSNLKEDKRQIDNDPESKAPTYWVVAEAARQLDLEPKDVMDSIAIYAERNELMHSNLEPMVEEGRWSELAVRLYTDYCDVPRLITLGEGRQAHIIQDLIKEFIDKWFDQDAEFDDIHAWVRSEKVKKLREDLKGDEEKAEVAWKECIREIIRDAQARPDAPLRTNLKDEIEKIPVAERAAREKAAEEARRLETRRKEWREMVDMAAELRELRDSYLETYGELATPPILVRDDDSNFDSDYNSD